MKKFLAALTLAAFTLTGVAIAQDPKEDTKKEQKKKKKGKKKGDDPKKEAASN